MQLTDVLKRFEIESPISVMVRTMLQHVLESDRLDALFAKHASQQKCGELLFSTVADLMALVAINAKPSVHAAYKHRTKERVGVAIASIYNKLQGIEPAVSRAVVFETAQCLGIVLNRLRAYPKRGLRPGSLMEIISRARSIVSKNSGRSVRRPCLDNASPSWTLIVV